MGMSQLIPCEECRRHVVSTAAACPFCGFPRMSTPTSSLRVQVSRLSRAAVFAGMTSCWSSSSPAPAPLPAEQTQTQTQTAQAPAFDDRNAPYPDPRRAPTPRPDRASLVARFTDRSYQLMPNLKIRIEGPESRTVTTGPDGIVIVENLLPGKYTVTVEGRPGPDYAPLVSELELTPGRVTPMGMLGEHMTNAEAAPKPIDRSACCKPYGAPPARRRVV
jgi:hypothetical protein